MVVVLELLALFCSLTDAEWSLDLLFATSVSDYQEHKFKTCGTWKDLCSPREKTVCHVSKTKPQMSKIPTQPQNQSAPSVWAGDGSPFLLLALSLFQPTIVLCGWRVGRKGYVWVPSHSERQSWHACGLKWAEFCCLLLFWCCSCEKAGATWLL